MGAVIYMLLFLAQFSSIYSSLPKVYFKCHVWDSGCSRTLTQLNVAAIASGIQELGTEVLDPMVIDNLNVDIAGLKMNLQNVVGRGLKNTVIDRATLDPILKVVTILYHVDLDVNGRYNAGGNLLGFPFYGDGLSRFQPKNLKIELVMPFDIVKGKDGKDVIEMKSFQYSYDVADNTQLEFSNLFYGNKELSDTLHRFVNTNARLVTLVYGRPFLDAMNQKIFNAIRTFYLTVPIEDIYY